MKKKNQLLYASIVPRRSRARSCHKKSFFCDILSTGHTHWVKTNEKQFIEDHLATSEEAMFALIFVETLSRRGELFRSTDKSLFTIQNR